MGKELIEYIAKALVDEPDAVSVDEIDSGDIVSLQLRVAEGDIGKVIGKSGRIAKALRTVLAASGGQAHRQYSLDILD